MVHGCADSLQVWREDPGAAAAAADGNGAQHDQEFWEQLVQKK